MNKLSDNLRHIGDSWAIERGRYAGAGPMNQSVLSPTDSALWAIAAQPNLTYFRTHP